MATFDERQQAWEEFLQRWPLRTLSKLTPSTYNKSGDQDTFTYWLEFGPGRLLGSIKGGDSSKLGLYERKNEPKGPRAHVQAGDVYSWKKKYGTSVDEAFTTIRSRIVEVAKAAGKGDSQRVQEIDLEHVLKWKVAFIYQDVNAPCVLPIYNYKSLCAIAGETDKRVTQAELYARLLELRGEEPVLAYGFDLWNAMEDESDDEEVGGGWESEGDTKEKAYEPPLNQILFGPPGTGKTYNTINQALAILAPEFLAQNSGDNSESRKRLKTEFDRFVAAERVRFVTFHQSFSYEDFVEGLRALPPNSEGNPGATLAYDVAKGVFVQLCLDASGDPVLEQKLGLKKDPTIWKISIEEASSDGRTRRYCFQHGEARIGWHKVGDIRQVDLADPALKLGSNDKSSLASFGGEVEEGDVLVCLGTRKSICAVGVVTGEYEYNPEVPEGVRKDYVHRLPVNWLLSDIDFDITTLNGGRGLTLKTLYPMSRISWPELQQGLQQAGLSLAGEAKQPAIGAKLPYVLIIDEINRGNISRIFGELISLIEPSKRAGASEALEAVLPYSKRHFSVPDNVYLIGTMNTADRSLAGLDIALRRRFVFREMPPRPELLDAVEVQGLNIGKLLRVMNQRIEVLLDRDHCLGHAYFMPLKGDPTLARLESTFRNQILPLLQEYFFEDWQRIQWVFNDHRKPVVDRFVEQDKQDVAALFGNISVPAQGGVWRINAAAFKRFSAYAGVIAVNAKAEAPAEELEEASA
ncbi:AAA family ATPase [Pseudomonas hunanensis]|uniref:AAA family ATPase n=1 Tax=Pseudomonas TaxID=286 RepID=UPI00209BC555|nr:MULTISPECIES: AAA family ATPase [Pseudomonas]MDH1930694.1 AAA family ATPase [Pseudomonas sp. GD03696]